MRIILFVMLFVHCQSIAQPLERMVNFVEVDFQDSLRCNLNTITNLEKQLQNPSKTDILNFLYSFDASCELNVEYSQYSNEILLRTLYEHTLVTLSLLTEPNVNTVIILKEIKNPVNDTYKSSDIIERVKELPSSDIKEKVIEVLKSW